MTLLVSGWVAIDEIETPFDKVESSLGGSATCAALGAELFTDVRLLAAVGEDFPAKEREKLEGRGIDLAGLTVIPGGETSRWGGRYHYDMNTRDTLYTVLGVNESWAAPLPAGWEDCTAAFMAADDPKTQRRLIGELSAARVTMVDTIKLYIDIARDEFVKTMAAASFVSINESEARELSGKPGIVSAGRELIGKGAQAILVKLGEYGAAYMGNGDHFVAPGYPLEEVTDPTGAGDAFAGGFMGYLDSVQEISAAEVRKAVVYGSTVASFAVEGFGPSRLLTLTRDEVESRYREFKALTQFEVTG